MIGKRVIDVMVRKHDVASAYTRSTVQRVASSGKPIEAIVLLDKKAEIVLGNAVINPEHLPAWLGGAKTTPG